MDRRTKAALNRDKASRLSAAWGVGAAEVRYNHDGHWYAALERFPAALFDARGYVVFETEQDYRNSPYLRIGKQISVGKPGISAIPSYVRVIGPDAGLGIDPDIHDLAASEGRQKLILHLERERNHTVVRRKKRKARALDCEICGFSFARAYGASASDYCEVHHLVPLSETEQVIRTRMEDLAILCANCHRVVHLRNPPYTLDEVKRMMVSCGEAPEVRSGVVGGSEPTERRLQNPTAMQSAAPRANAARKPGSHQTVFPGRRSQR